MSGRENRTRALAEAIANHQVAHGYPPTMGDTSDGCGAFTYLAPLMPGEAVFLIRAGDAAKGQEIWSDVTIAVGA